MAVARCSECRAKLVKEDGTPKRAGTHTCSPVCRQRRIRRLERSNKQRVQTAAASPASEVAAIVRGETKDVAHEVMKEELRPVVREAMTQDVLSRIHDLVAITGEAVTTLATQLGSDDETIAQRAATTILRYTMGNPSVAPPPAEQQPQGMTVVFNVPRPGDTTSGVEEPGDAVELRTCAECAETKTAPEFVGDSMRCQACDDKIQEQVRARFG